MLVGVVGGIHALTALSSGLRSSASRMLLFLTPMLLAAGSGEAAVICREPGGASKARYSVVLAGSMDRLRTTRTCFSAVSAFSCKRGTGSDVTCHCSPNTEDKASMRSPSRPSNCCIILSMMSNVARSGQRDAINWNTKCFVRSAATSVVACNRGRGALTSGPLTRQ